MGAARRRAGSQVGRAPPGRGVPEPRRHTARAVALGGGRHSLVVCSSHQFLTAAASRPLVYVYAMIATALSSWRRLAIAGLRLRPRMYAASAPHSSIIAQPKVHAGATSAPRNERSKEASVGGGWASPRDAQLAARQSALSRRLMVNKYTAMKTASSRPFARLAMPLLSCSRPWPSEPSMRSPRMTDTPMLTLSKTDVAPRLLLSESKSRRGAGARSSGGAALAVRTKGSSILYVGVLHTDGSRR